MVPFARSQSQLFTLLIFHQLFPSLTFHQLVRSARSYITTILLIKISLRSHGKVCCPAQRDLASQLFPLLKFQYVHMGRAGPHGKNLGSCAVDDGGCTFNHNALRANALNMLLYIFAFKDV